MKNISGYIAIMQQIWSVAGITLRTLLFRNGIPVLLISIITPLLLLSFSWSLHNQSIPVFIALAVLLPALGIAFGILPNLIAEQLDQRELHFWMQHPFKREVLLAGYIAGSILPMIAGTIINVWYVDTLMHLTFHNVWFLLGIVLGTIAAWIVLATVGIFLGLIVPHPREAIMIGIFIGLVLGADLVISLPAHTENLWMIIAPYLPTSLCEQIIHALYVKHVDTIALLRGSLGLVVYGVVFWSLTLLSLPQRQVPPVATVMATKNGEAVK